MNKILIIFEMANNHMGDFDHAREMIKAYAKIAKQYENVFNFAWKFQFRDIDSFIHKNYIDSENRYVKRFRDTKLSKDQFIELQKYAKDLGFITVCTGFDEKSVDNIKEMQFDIIKVASCSFTDWPLLNKIADDTNIPIILSTAGSSIEEIDKAVSFLQHRSKDFSLMHCVGEYPTETQSLQLNQIDLLNDRYPKINIGYSTHEKPEEINAIKIAIAKNISIVEKHVALENEKYPINLYSTTPEQMVLFLESAKSTLEMCGVKEQRHQISEKERTDLLQFKRGVFAKRNISTGETINKKDLYYAWPSENNQLLANNLSKYNSITATSDISTDAPIMFSEIKVFDTRENVWGIVQNIKNFLKEINIIYPKQLDLEISHHYGIESFYKTGLTMLTLVNREYCKKLLILLPGQEHPEQYHKIKEETFVIVHGSIDLFLDNNKQLMNCGDIITIKPNTKHRFYSEHGCVIEEISSRHESNDSYYTDESIHKNNNRKTLVTHWL
jgi:sialic acid synthase SpsE/mannose-6-phosphate isomerase-like protein (cupin superfamily)